VLDSVVFLGSAGLLWAIHAQHLGMAFHAFMHHGMAAHDAAAHGADASAPPHEMARAGGYAGWSAFVWAVFFCYVWLGSFKAGLVRMLFLLGFWLTPLSLALGAWTGMHFFLILGGYLGLVTAILALIVSACAIIGHGCASAAPAAPKAG
jgi:succinate-acetate transporter protein